MRAAPGQITDRYRPRDNLPLFPGKRRSDVAAALFQGARVKARNGLHVTFQGREYVLIVDALTRPCAAKGRNGQGTLAAGSAPEFLEHGKHGHQQGGRIGRIEADVPVLSEVRPRRARDGRSWLPRQARLIQRMGLNRLTGRPLGGKEVEKGRAHGQAALPRPWLGRGRRNSRIPTLLRRPFMISAGADSE